MDLLLAVDLAVAVEQVGDVVKLVVLHREVRTPDDVDVVLRRQAIEEFQVLGSEFRESTGCQSRSCRLHTGKQLHGEQFGEQHKVAFVVGSNIHEVFALLGELFEAADAAHHVLDHA